MRDPSPIVLNVNGIEVIYNHVILVLMFPSGARGQDCGHFGRQWCGQNDHAARCF
jgi:hypothetical protein